MFGFTKQITAVLASIFVIGLFFASPAAAENGPVFLPGGNGPDDPLVFNPDLVIAPVFPSASVAASCTNETATVTVSNPTNNNFKATIQVDGVNVQTNVTVGAKLVHKKTVSLAENETKAVKVVRGNITMLDTEVTRDCLKPAPAYDVLTNCETEQAHARLINNGDDTAMMAIQYGEGAYAHQPIAAHSSKDWLLTVNPNESVSFNVVHSSTIVGSEDLLFDCPVEKPEVEKPEVEKPEVEKPEVEKPEVEKPEVEKPEVEKPEVETPEVETPEVEKPEVEKPEVETPEVETPETTGSAIDDNDENVPEGGGDPDGQDVDTEGVDSTHVDTEVKGDVEQLALADITEIGTASEIVGEIAGPTLANVEAESGMGFMKMALISIWLLVLVAAGIVGVLVNRRRAQTS